MAQVTPVAFNSDHIRKIIEASHKGNSGDNNGPNVAYIPEGRHTIRWFFDPTGALFREVMIGRVGKKRFVCPDFLSRVDKTSGIDYPPCEIDAIAKERDTWKDKCRYHCLAYGYVYDTKNANEYWKAGAPCVIIGNSYLKRALLEMLENLQENGMDMLLAMLTPQVRGFFSSVSVTKGQQGNIAIQVLAKSVEPIELGEWYRPLSDVYINREFDEKTYNEAVSEYKANLPEVEDAVAEAAAGVLEDQDTVEHLTVSTAKPMVTPVTSASFASSNTDADADLDAEAVEISPRVQKPGTAAKKTTRKRTGEMPDGVTLEMLPDGCPGWASYQVDSPICALCDYNIDCMGSGDAKS